MPSSAVFYRSLDKAYPVAVGGQGVHLFTKDGEKILDGSSGAAVSSIGHNNQEVVDAIVAQARGLSFAHSSFFTSDPVEELATFLLEQSKGSDFSRVNFLCSGSEAVESALKLVRQYHIYNGQPERTKFIGRHHSYHGNTMGAMAIGFNPPRRQPFEAILSRAFHHVSRCFYDQDANGRSEQHFEDDLIAEYESKIQELGATTIAAVVVEPVVGATLGTVPATKTYLPRLKQLCEKHGVLLVFDEVMCGMARVGSYHAWQCLGGFPPDVQTIGKGLGGGYLPLSAILISTKVASVFEQNRCASALAVQKIIQRDDLVQNARRQGLLLEKMVVKALPAELKALGASMRGLGLFRSIDFGNSKTKFGGPLAAQVAEETFKNGATVYLCSGAVDAVMFAPPLIIANEELAELGDKFQRAVRTVLSRRVSAAAVKHKL
ncbi:uncharacterized protein LTR77_000007 [Saxophila tyrrhenica]|uniref:Uncharacterized protein n=1 Tax=Saxophila tyrrhenica TaxID=1690608 RepID=A0AAV9PM36_9PEZI|nr:hypothetical protein LTR77_000007 [Saxophila tyrrhenica]